MRISQPGLLLLGVASLLATGQGCSKSVARVDPTLFPEPAPNSITFWGHACAYIDVDGYGIVTDPVFQKATIFRRRKVPAPPPESYSNVGVVLISHAHPDHLSPNTIETFPSQAVVLCPEPSAKYLSELEQEVRVMTPGDEYEYPGGRVIAVPALHNGGRYSLFSKGSDGRALGYVIETSDATVYYSGDTNYSYGIERIGMTHRPDIALLNINGHLHSSDAIFAAWASRAGTIIPMHWGAYGYLFLPTSDRPRDYEEMKKILGHQLVTLKLGESIGIERKEKVAPLP